MKLHGLFLVLVVSLGACHGQKPDPADKEKAPVGGVEKPAGPAEDKKTAPEASAPAKAVPAAAPEPPAEAVTASAPREEARQEAMELAKRDGLEDSRMVGDMTVVGLLKSAEAVPEGAPPPAPGGAATGASGEDGEAEEDAAGGKDKGKEGHKAEEVKTWKRARVVPNMSQLSVGDAEELPLKGMQVQARVDGFRARVVLDLHFFNDRQEQLEGTFKLRLPDGASPYFLAFGGEVIHEERPPSEVAFQPPEKVRTADPSAEGLLAAGEGTWTDVKAARMVPKEKAALAYQETVRRRVDPALMEWSGAGVFSSRVFPLQPGRLHKIVVAYDVDLLAAGGDLVYALDLPPTSVPVVVDLQVASAADLTHTVSPGAEPVPAEGAVWYRFEPATAPTISVRVARPGAVLLTGDDPQAGTFSAARFQPQLPEVVSSEPAQAVDRAVFLVDTSLSENPERFNIWLALVQAILAENRDGLREFAVLFFNVESFWWKEGFSPNTPEEVEALAAFMKTLSLEGATDLDAALAAAAAPVWLPVPVQDETGTLAPELPAWDVFLLSDGAVTWGDGDLHALAARLPAGGRRPLFAYRTGLAGTDTAALTHLTRESGGALFTVAGEAEVPAAATAHRARPWSIAGVELEGCGDLLLAGRPVALFPGQELTLAGRGTPAEGAAIRLRLSQPGRETLLEIPLAARLSSALAPRLYGQVAVDQLEGFGAASEDVSGAFARHFRVVGQTTSLLMLESEEDYQRYGIRPEEDAVLVKGTPAAARVARILQEIGAALGDPRAAFLAWIGRLKAMPGMTFEIPAALSMVLEQLPVAAFRVDAPPLVCGSRAARDLPGPLQEQLITRQLEYDAWSTEATRRLQAYGPADALKALSNLVENSPGDSVLARDVGFSAMELGLGGQAYHLFRRVAAARPFEPQTYRAMAQALVTLGAYDLALLYFEVGMLGTWDSRFGEFRRILLMDYQKFLQQVAAGTWKVAAADYAAARLQTVSSEIGMQDADLVVMIDWNTDGTDVDLHVLEPTGEECYYSNASTRIGGRLTMDVTRGYGPEMYVLPKAPPGTYQIKAKYFSSDRNRASTRTKVFATIYRDWSRPGETVQKKTVVLADDKEMHELATIVVK